MAGLLDAVGPATIIGRPGWTILHDGMAALHVLAHECGETWSLSDAVAVELLPADVIDLVADHRCSGGVGVTVQARLEGPWSP